MPTPKPTPGSDNPFTQTEKRIYAKYGMKPYADGPTLANGKQAVGKDLARWNAMNRELTAAKKSLNSRPSSTLTGSGNDSADRRVYAQNGFKPYTDGPVIKATNSAAKNPADIKRWDAMQKDLSPAKKKATMAREAKRDALASARNKAGNKDAFGASGGWEGMTNMTTDEKRAVIKKATK
jgi:hypothetical protein